MKKVFAVFVLVFLGMVAGADDERAQYPAVLRNSYVEAAVSHMDIPLSAAQLEPGNTVASVKVPHLGARLGIGHHFSQNLGVHISYMRPAQWAKYQDINGIPGTRTVWTNVAALTFRGTIPLGKRLSFYDESGLGIVTRHGFQDADGRDIVKNANYATIMWGAGFTYRVGHAWDLSASAAYLPRNARFNQPHILVASVGAVLNMRPRPLSEAPARVASSAAFPKHLIMFSHSTDELGSGVNRFFSSRVPIFWNGNAEVTQGISLRYQRNIFQRRVFSLDWGASVGHWWSKQEGKAFTSYSLFPYFRFTPIHTKPADLYAFYSVAGPTYVTKRVIDRQDTGGRFTFQDLMGVGLRACADRRLTMEVSIGHYSNGNLLPRNAGIRIPLTVSLGYSW